MSNKREVIQLNASIVKCSQNDTDNSNEYIVSVASEAKVEQWYGALWLSCAEGAVDFSRVKNKNAFITWDHDYSRLPLGKIDDAYIENGKVLTKFQFDTESGDEFALQIKNKVDNGFIVNVSVGAEINESTFVEAGDTVGSITADEAGRVITNWTLYEFSFCNYPANNEVGVERFHNEGAPPTENNTTTKVENEEESEMPPKEDEAVATVDTAQETVNAEEITLTERKRTADILTFGKQMNEDVSEYIAKGASYSDTVQAVLLARETKKAEEQSKADDSTQVRATVGVEQFEKQKDAITTALLHRAGFKKAEGDAGEFANIPLSEVARFALEKHGKQVDKYANAATITRELFKGTSFMSAADFVSIMDNVANKAAMMPTHPVVTTYEQITQTTINKDARPMNLYDWSGTGVLPEVHWEGEITYDYMNDMGISNEPKPYAKIMGVTEQMIINDDVGFFERFTNSFVQAGRRTVEKLLYTGYFLGNPNVQFDSLPLFTDVTTPAEGTRRTTNIYKTASGTGTATLDAISGAYQLMAAQMTFGKDQELLGLTPRYIICSPMLHPQLELLTRAITNPEQPNPAVGVPSYVNGITVIKSNYLTGDTWYAMADPAECPVFDIIRIEGYEGPQVTVRESFTRLALEMRVLEYFGLSVVNPKGIVKVEKG